MPSQQITVIPITVSPDAGSTHVDCTANLDGRIWYFSFFTARDGTAAPADWYFSLRADLRTPLLEGIGLAMGLDLLAPYRHLDVPRGVLYLVDQGRIARDPQATAVPQPDDTTLVDNDFFAGRVALHYLQGYDPSVDG